MATQIDQLRSQFDGMSTTKKKQFIAALKSKVDRGNSPTLSALLKECEQKYNAEVYGGTQPFVSNGTVPAQTSRASVQSKKAPEIIGAASKKLPLKIGVALLGVIIVAIAGITFFSNGNGALPNGKYVCNYDLSSGVLGKEFTVRGNQITVPEYDYMLNGENFTWSKATYTYQFFNGRLVLTPKNDVIMTVAALGVRMTALKAGEEHFFEFEKKSDRTYEFNGDTYIRK